MKKVSIIGAGNVGASAAMKIASMNIVDKVVLLDIKEGIPAGKAADINQCASLLNFNTEVVGVSNDYSATENSDIIVITSGLPRKPGMTREELVGVNSKILADVVSKCHEYSNKAIYIIVSNPMDTMTYYTHKILKSLGRNDVNKTVFGMGGLLDSARFKYYIKEALNKTEYKDTNVSDIYAWVIGMHGDKTMIPLFNYAYINTHLYPHSLCDIFSPKDRDEIIEKTMKGGATLTNLLGTSAWEAPAAAIADTVKSIINDENKLMPVSLYNENDDVCIGTLVTVGNDGATLACENDIFEDYEIEYKNSIESVRKVNNELPTIN